MADIEHLIEKKGLPSLDAIIKLYADMQSHAGSGNEERICFGRGPAAFNRIARFLDAIGLPRSLIHPDGQRGWTLDRSLALGLKRCLGDLVENVEDLLSFQAGRHRQQVISLATSPLIGTRPLPHWLREFHEGFTQIRDVYGMGQDIGEPRVSMTYGEPYDLLEDVLHSPTVDLVLTYCDRSREFSEGIQLARCGLHRCLLVRTGHPLSDQLSKDHDGSTLPILDRLKGARVALIADRRTIPAIPFEKISKVADVLQVGSTIEAHSHVRARSVDAAFSFRELLSEGENKYLSVFDLRENPEVHQSDLVLLRGRGYPRAEDSERAHLTKALANHLKTQMDLMHSRFQQLRGVTALLRRFPYAYHTSEDYRGGRKSPIVRWFRGSLEMQATIPFISKPERYIWLVKGKHRLDDGDHILDVFGRVVGPDAGGRFHMLWRETRMDDEHGAGSFFFSENDLASSETLVGAWIGKSSWTDGCSAIPSSGLFVLDSVGGRSERKLNSIISQAAKSSLLQRTLASTAKDAKFA